MVRPASQNSPITARLTSSPASALPTGERCAFGGASTVDLDYKRSRSGRGRRLTYHFRRRLELELLSLALNPKPGTRNCEDKGDRADLRGLCRR